jgi:kinesin family member 13
LPILLALKQTLIVANQQEHTLVGRKEAPVEQDIQLSGLGIQPEHCVLKMEGEKLYTIPLEGARTYVNGFPITEKTLLHHGDRLLWGNHHFFRVNCPKSTSKLKLWILT